MEELTLSKPFLFLNMITATWSTQLLAAAAELRIADTLKDGPLSAADIAERTKTDASVMYRILRALVSIGVLEQNEKRFSLGELGQFLRSDVPGSMRSLAMMVGAPWHNRVWEALAQCARTGVAHGSLHAFGSDLWKYFDENRKDFDNFNEAMTGASTNMHVTAVDAYDFSGIKKLVDVGGGHGRLLGMILQKHPSMRGVLFDRPALAVGARAELEILGIADRAEFVGGNFFEAVPAGGDAYMMSHILHDWPDENALTILRNCRKSIVPGGRIIVLDAVIDASDARDWGKLMDLEIMLMFGGRDRTAAELGDLFRAAGFTLRRVIPTASTISVIEGIAV